MYYYTVVLFGFKNASVTYQRAMSVIFKENLRKSIKCYVDDLAIKSENENHLQDLRAMFNLIRKYQLK